MFCFKLFSSQPKYTRLRSDEHQSNNNRPHALEEIDLFAATVPINFQAKTFGGSNRAKDKILNKILVQSKKRDFPKPIATKWPIKSIKKNDSIINVQILILQEDFDFLKSKLPEANLTRTLNIRGLKNLIELEKSIHEQKNEKSRDKEKTIIKKYKVLLLTEIDKHLHNKIKKIPNSKRVVRNSQNKQFDYKHVIKKIFTYSIAFVLLLYNGALSLIGLNGILTTVFMFNPVTTSIICLIMCTGYLLIFYNFDFNVIKEGMGLNAMHAVITCLLFDKKEMHYTREIELKLSICNDEIKTTNKELRYYNFIQSQLNNNMTYKKESFNKVEKIKTSTKIKLGGLAIAGLCMAASGAYFGVMALLAAVTLTPFFLSLSIVGVITAVGLSYISLQVKGLSASLNPYAAMLKEVKSEVEKFEIYDRVLKDRNEFVSGYKKEIYENSRIKELRKLREFKRRMDEFALFPE